MNEKSTRSKARILQESDHTGEANKEETIEGRVYGSVWLR